MAGSALGSLTACFCYPSLQAQTRSCSHQTSAAKQVYHQKAARISAWLSAVPFGGDPHTQNQAQGLPTSLEETCYGTSTGSFVSALVCLPSSAAAMDSAFIIPHRGSPSPTTGVADYSFGRVDIGLGRPFRAQESEGFMVSSLQDVSHKRPGIDGRPPWPSQDSSSLES